MNAPYPPQSHLVLDLKRHWFAFMLGLMTPAITLNGYPVPGRWGRVPIPLAPGQYHLHIHLPYLMPSQIGPADLTVWLQPGQALELEYRAPLWAYSRGALGTGPQPWPGKGIMIGLVTFLLLFILLIVVLVIVAIVAGS